MADRAGYAARQAALLDALMRGGDYPAGFDAERADRAGSSLRRKRARAVQSAWPALSAALGSDFEARFDAFARATGPPASEGGLVDGLAFVDWSPGKEPAMTEPVVIELLLARASLRRRRSPTGFVRRRGVFVGARRLSDPHRLVVVLRAPGVGRRLASVPLPRIGRRRSAEVAKRPNVDEAAADPR